MALYEFTDRINEQKEQLALEKFSSFENFSFSQNEMIPGDSRSCPRKDYVMQVRFAHKGRMCSGTSKNLSYSGIFIKVDDTKACHENDLLTMTFVSSIDKPLILKGKIVRKDNSGIGVHFLNH